MTDRLDLPLPYRTQIHALLREHVPEAEVWAYGSRVNGSSHEASDLDLVLRGPNLERLGTGYLDLLEAIEESNIPILVQAHDWATLPESLRRESERAYVPIQEPRKDLHPRQVTWSDVTLGDLLSFSNGASSPERSDSFPHPVYGSNGIIGSSIKTNTGPNAVVIGRVGSYCGSLHFSEKPSWVTDNAIRGNPVEGTDAKFVYYLLRTLNLNEWRTGSGQPLLNQAILSSIPTTVPSLPEQRAIAHILGSLDDKIELNRRMNETLEQMARALFKSWFVDFDPVRAKMEGRWRPGQSLPGLPAHLYDLFPSRLVPSELGPIPDGWDVKPLDQIVQLNSREPLKKGTVAPYIDMAALPTSGPSPDNAVSREFKNGTRFRNGDTLFARITPCLENGKTAFVQSLPKGTVGWGSTEFIVLRAVPPVPPEYTYLLARDAGFREHAIQSMTGTSGRQRVQVDALAPYPLPNPPAETWNAFSALVSPMFAQIEFNRRESLALAAQRDTLLPGLVSGDVRVAIG